MKHIVLAIAALVALCGVAHAQSTPDLATVVATCGTPPSTYTAGQNRPVLQDTTGAFCTNASGGGGGDASAANQLLQLTQETTTATEVTLMAAALGSPSGGTAATKSLLEGGIYNSSPITLTNGQQASLQFDANGYLKVNVVTATGVAQASTTSGQTISPIGCRTLNAPATDTTAQTNMPRCALDGGFVVWPYSNPENLVSAVTAAMTGTTSTVTLAAPAAGLRNYVTNLVCTNSHATVGTFVLVQDDSGGTTIYEAYAAAVGGGFTIQFPAPLRQPTTAKGLYVQDVTTGANVICSVSGFKAP